MSAFTLQIDKEGVGNLLFDMPNASVNLLSTPMLMELSTLLDEIATNKDIKAMLITSAKKGIFIAGADISEIEGLTDEDEAYDKVRQGQMILAKIAALKFPTIAVINGACLGGGFELALRCTYRICTENSQTKIGLPEVNLGVLPGFGGTQKLKQLIGPAKALELILAGKVINGAKALKLGMVDICVPEGYLDFRIMPFVKQILTSQGRESVMKRRHKKGFVEKFLPSMIWRVATKTVMKKSKGHYPAPLSIIKLFKKTQVMPINLALNHEARAFAKLAVTPESKNLISLFYVLEGIKNEKPLVSKEEMIPLNITSIVGGGVMGGGIVWLLSKIDLLVRLKVRGFPQAGHTMQAVAKAYDALKKRRRLNSREIDMKMAHISYGTDYKSLQHSDLTIEAIVENIEAKQECYGELEAVMRED
ncbi:MAG: enoyl-CoA hydratase-related protein, partial [Thiovulaceae bacterium]|nr:enoyl-CoA hydratase-related protein [Sulfurimonadaceae bacterium]